MLRLYSVVRGSLAVRKNRLRSLTTQLDVSSPPDKRLDVESLGMITRDTDFKIYPAGYSLRRILHEADCGEDLVANIFHRAVEVIEQVDCMQRQFARKKFQTELFLACQDMLVNSSDKKYSIFSIYNKNVISKVSPKLKGKHELIMSLVQQPLLQLCVENRSVFLDPNEVMQESGVGGFKCIWEKYRIDVTLLDGRNMDRFIDSFLGPCTVQHDLVRVWSELVGRVYAGSPLSIQDSIVPHSNWTYRKVLNLVIKKQNELLLRELFDGAPECVRPDLMRYSLSRHAITGMPRFPWANEIILSWLTKNRMTIPEGEGLHISKGVVVKPTDPSVAAEYSHATFSLDSSRIFLINSNPQLTELLRVVSDNCQVAITFPFRGLISLSFGGCSYVIDETSVEPIFLAHFLKQLLCNRELKKIISNLDHFLRVSSAVIGRRQPSNTDPPSLHFENVVDIRGARIRRGNVVFDSAGVNIDNLLQNEGIAEDRSDSGSLSSASIEHFSGNVPLSVMTAQYLNKTIKPSTDQFRDMQLLVRPILEEVLHAAAADSAVVLALEEYFQKRRILPTELLRYDPFEEENNDR